MTEHCMQGSSSKTAWTDEQSETFKSALVRGAEIFTSTPIESWDYTVEADDCWSYIAREVGDGKTVEDVREYYEQVKEDLKDIVIEELNVPNPDYKPPDAEHQDVQEKSSLRVYQRKKKTTTNKQ